MNSTLSPLKSEFKRLILAKGVYMHGCTHARNKDEVSRLLAIHHFDFAIEIILKCLGTKYNILETSRREFKFKDLWNEIVNAGTKLTLREQIFNLRDIRNLAQHGGVIPPQEEVIKLRGYVEDFLRNVIQAEFGIKFDELTLAELIENESLKKILKDAENAFSEERYKECISKCIDALTIATFDIANIFEKAGILSHYFGADEELKRVISKDYAEKYRDKEFYELAKELGRAIHQLGMASTGMQFLDEYRIDFLRFMETVVKVNLHHLPEDELKEYAQFSLDFVINLFMKWQDEGLLKDS